MIEIQGYGLLEKLRFSTYNPITPVILHMKNFWIDSLHHGILQHIRLKLRV